MNLETALRESADQLAEATERHRALLAAASQAGEGPLFGERCVALRCPCRAKYRETITEAIHVLEATRKSFKSRQLAVLRQKLIDSLAEEA